MKKLLFLLILVSSQSFAQDTLRKGVPDTSTFFKRQFLTSFNFSQVHLSNWAAGGQSSFSATSLFSVVTNYRKGKITWDNNLDMAYGLIRQGDVKTFVKSDDKIDGTTKFGHNAFKNWSYSLLLNFRSQMAPGYKYPNDSVLISHFLAPAYIITALGLDYKPNNKFSLFISPLTSRLTIVNDRKLSDEGAFGVEKGKKTLKELGSYVKIMFVGDIMPNVNLKAKVDLYSNYLKDPQNIVVNGEFLIVMKVNKFISTTISTQLLYDDKVKVAIDKDKDGKNDSSGPRLQAKEVIGVGLTYKF